MKNRIFTLFLAILLPIFLISTPVFADSAEVGGFIRDHSNIFDDEVEAQLEVKAEALYNELGISVYLISANDADETTVDEGANQYAVDNGITMDDTAYILYFNTATRNFISIFNELYVSKTAVEVMDIELIKLWSDMRYNDGAGYYIDTVSSVIRGDLDLSVQDTQPDDIKASYVMDTAGLLSAEQVTTLEARMSEFALEETFGIYILTVDDFTQLYGYTDPWDTVTQFYSDKNLGVGDGKDGFILMLSMDDRDYANAIYGDKAHAIFDDDAMDSVIDSILDDLGDDDWYGAFDQYVDSVIYEFGPVGEIISVVFITIGSFAIALIVGFTFKGQLKSVAKKHSASEYVPFGGVDMIASTDVFTHTTETRTKIVKSSGGGGGSGSGRSGGGFSGGSGKF